MFQFSHKNYDSRNIHNKEQKCVFYLQILEKCQELIIDDKATVKLMDLVLHEVNRGLSKKENKEADIKCYVTYIQDLPNGKGKRTK